MPSFNHGAPALGEAGQGALKVFASRLPGDLWGLKDRNQWISSGFPIKNGDFSIQNCDYIVV